MAPEVVHGLGPAHPCHGGPPRLSVVFGVHNPSYEGDLLLRTQLCLSGLIELADRYRVHLEIVIVEWNPDPGQSAFREGLRWPASLGRVVLRFIEVPSSIHDRFPNAARLPIFEYLAKNVGLRRARGEYLLATNPDVFYGAALVKLLAGRSLAPRRFYRVDRRDLSMPIPRELPIDDQLRFCRRHVSRVHAFCGSYTPRRQFLRGHDWRRILESQYAALRAGAPIPDGSATIHPEAALLFPIDGLHRNAAGDFFLMAREHWHDLRGYPELHTHAHIDAIMCWIAASAGLEQVILPSWCRLYHQFHERHQHATFPQTDWRPWYARYLEARRTGRRLVHNDEGWGLAREPLREWVAGPGRSLELCATPPLSP